MAEHDDSMNRPGGMRWNYGGWFGSQLGGSCWMLVAGVLAIPADRTAAVAVLGLFALANLAGLLIWRRRDSLSPYKGLQLLIPILGLTGIGAVYVLDRAGIFEAIQVGASVTAAETYAILIIVVAALMIMFWWQNRRN